MEEEEGWSHTSTKCCEPVPPGPPDYMKGGSASLLLVNFSSPTPNNRRTTTVFLIPSQEQEVQQCLFLAWASNISIHRQQEERTLRRDQKHRKTPQVAPETCPLSAQSSLDKDGPCALFSVNLRMVTTQAAASGRQTLPRGAGQAGAEAAGWTPVFSVIKFFTETLFPTCSSQVQMEPPPRGGWLRGFPHLEIAAHFLLTSLLRGSTWHHARPGGVQTPAVSQVFLKTV